MVYNVFWAYRNSIESRNLISSSFLSESLFLLLFVFFGLFVLFLLLFALFFLFFAFFFSFFVFFLISLIFLVFLVGVASALFFIRIIKWRGVYDSNLWTLWKYFLNETYFFNITRFNLKLNYSFFLIFGLNPNKEIGLNSLAFFLMLIF